MFPIVFNCRMFIAALMRSYIEALIQVLMDLMECMFLWVYHALNGSEVEKRQNTGEVSADCYSHIVLTRQPYRYDEITRKWWLLGFDVSD